jgi:hypothetical protein
MSFGTLAAFGAALAISATLIAQANKNFAVASGPSSEIPQILMTRSAQVILSQNIEAAGDWLRANNDGGNILASPYIGIIPSRGILAMGGYDGVQSYDAARIVFARDLPPFGAEPLEKALATLENPGASESQQFIRENDIRYVVVHKRPAGELLDFREYEAREKLYKSVYQNPRVAIYEPLFTGEES